MLALRSNISMAIATAMLARCGGVARRSRTARALHRSRNTDIIETEGLGMSTCTRRARGHIRV